MPTAARYPNRVRYGRHMGPETPTVLILAGGASRRLGTPKGLVVWQDQTLLERVIVLGASVSSDVVVVTGGDAERLRPILVRLGTRELFHPDWATGMAGSLNAGLGAIPPDRWVLVLLLDQVAVTSAHLAALISAAMGEVGRAVATNYSGRLGVPALFPPAWRARLGACQGDQGARELLRTAVAEIKSVPAEFADLDLDTPEDLLNLRRL